MIDDPTGLSGADIEAILARALLMADLDEHGHTVASIAVLRHAFADFIPTLSQLERELQILAAARNARRARRCWIFTGTWIPNDLATRSSELRALVKS